MIKFISLLLSFVVAASSQNWFFKPAGDGSRPIVMGGSDIADRHGAIYMGAAEEKTVYLTFDAGYSNENVEKTLDVLKAHGAHATFFILPGIIKYNKDVVMRMIDEGHTLGNHSYSHRNMAFCADTESLGKELHAMEDYFREETGQELSKLFRPPEGAFSEEMLAACKELGYTCVFWSYAYADWNDSAQPDTEKALQRLIDNTHNGMVLLLHPTSATNAAILDSYLTELESRGFTVGNLSTLAAKQ